MPNDIEQVSPRSYHDIDSYHAHIYFDDKGSKNAAILRSWVAERFAVELGPWHNAAFGPHTTASYYFGFKKELLPTVLPWLILNRLGLTVLIHPNTDNPYDDHLVHALWLGTKQAINAERLPHSLKAIGQPLEVINVNTAPVRTDI